MLAAPAVEALGRSLAFEGSVLPKFSIAEHRACRTAGGIAHTLVELGIARGSQNNAHIFGLDPVAGKLRSAIDRLIDGSAALRRVDTADIAGGHDELDLLPGKGRR